MNRLVYEKLHISTSFIKGQDYLDIKGSVVLTDELTGGWKEGGNIRATVLSSNWSNQSFTVLTAGIDEKLFNCASCLEANNLKTGTVAFIIESDFGGVEREHEDRAFFDLNSFLYEVLQTDIIVTFLPFDPSVIKQLGYVRAWGPDKRAYSIKYNDGWTPSSSVFTQVETKSHESTVDVGWPTAPLLNRLRSVSLTETVPGLSEIGKCVVELFKDNGNIPLTKQQILKVLELNEEDEEDLSMALMDLLDLDLLEESDLKEEEKQAEEAILGGQDLLQAVQERDYAKVQKILLQRGVQVNEVLSDGRYALFIAIENMDLDMTKLLLEAGVDPNYENEDGMTALKLCWLTRNRAAEALLRKYGASLDM